MKEYEFLMGMSSSKPKNAKKATGTDLDAQMKIFKQNNPFFGSAIKTHASQEKLEDGEGFNLDAKSIISKLNSGAKL